MYADTATYTDRQRKPREPRPVQSSPQGRIAWIVTVSLAVDC
jgi:hypothetical protein